MKQILRFYKRDKWSVEKIAKFLSLSEVEIRMHLRAYGIEIKEKRKHNYPKTRKKGIYKNSQRYNLLQTYPESYIEETWIKYGIYKAGERLDANPKVIWHLAKDRGWKRPLPDFLAHAGNWKISENYYIKEEKNEQNSKERTTV